jgi:serine/threonine-protein kinase
MSPKPAIDINKFIGRELGTVTLLKVLGQGANGIVFVAFQRTLKRQVAVKILLKTERTTEESRQMFNLEAEMVAALSHPNIIPVFEMGEADDCYYQVMQLIKGSDLETVIENRLKNPLPTRRTLPINETVQIMRQVLDALGYAHEEGVIHQDIKPANTLMEERLNRPLIADFGIARTIEAGSSEKQVLVGSPLYMAPERVKEHSADARADIFSAGVMLFKMLVGKLPVSEHNVMALLLKKVKDPDGVFTQRPSQMSRTVDDGLEQIVYKAIAPDPEKRYQTCRDFDNDLASYGSTL